MIKALVLKEYRNLVYEDVPTPEAGVDDVLIRVEACGICGSDVHGYHGSTGRRIPPIIMGHEAADLGVRAMKKMPSGLGYNQSTYEAAIGWRPYATITFDVVPATPPKPALTDPPNYSVFKNVSPSITFRWSQVSPVTAYHVYVSLNGGLGDPKAVNARASSSS